MSKLTELERLFTHGRITRREFLSRLSALGLTAAISPALLTTSAHAATPKKGGSLKVGSADGSTSDTLNPATLVQSMPAQISFGQVRNCLVEWGPDGSAIPELAESWDVSPDAAKWTFKLRRGVEFHTGKTMEAEDVIYSINYHLGEDSKSVIKSMLKPIKEIRADGKYTVVITLDDGNADFPFVLGSQRAQIVPNGTKGNDFEKGIGTGGYILQHWEPGVRALVKRNPNYWKPNRAHFDEIETLAINDVNARTAALRTGQIHVMNRCDLKTAHLLDKMPELQVITASGGYNIDMPMHCNTAPFDDNNVRLAIKSSIDRNDLIKSIFHGYAEIGNDHPIHSASKYHAKGLAQRQYDPEKAKYYFKKAGLSKLKVQLHAADSAFTGAIDTALLSKEYAKISGIEIEVVRTPEDGYWNHTWRKKPWCMSYWGGRPTPDAIFSVRFASDAPYNDTFWKHDRFDQLLVLARRELDESKRFEMYAEMQQILSMDGGALIPLFKWQVDATTSSIKTPPLVGGQFELDYFKFGERWWFES